MNSFAILPAAGRSQRMGRHKLLMPWGESTVIESTLAAWMCNRLTAVLVVTRSDDRQLQQVCRNAGATVVVAPIPPPAMKDSVLLGLDHVERHYAPGPADVWLLAPADMPRLDLIVVERLLREHNSEESAILVPTANGQRGHPILLPWPLASDVRRLGPCEGINALLAGNRVRWIELANPTILDDLDTPDDYRRLRNQQDPT